MSLTKVSYSMITNAPVNVMDFGAVGNGVANDLSAIQSAIAATPEGGTLVFPEEKSFFIGDLVNDSRAFTITKNITILCNNSIFVCTGSGTGTSAAIFVFEDCKAYVDRMQLNQTNFNFAGTQRGVLAVLISAVAASVSGHYVKAHVINGQAPLTVVTSNPLLYRSSNIEVYLTGVNSYYGLNLASNGDQVIGYVFVKKYFRIVFVYDVDDVNIDVHGGDEPLDTSGQLNIFNKKVLPTSNIKIRAVFDALAGPIIIDDLTADAGTGKFVNIDLDVYVKTFTGTLASTYQSDGVIRIGSFRPDGNWETSVVQETEVQLSCSFKSAYSMTYPAMILYTPSNGRRTVQLRTENATILNADFLDWYSLNNNELTKLAVNSNIINIPVEDLTGITGPQIYIMDVVLSIKEDNAFSGQNTTTERWEVHGFSDGNGILNIQAYNRVYTSKTGAKTATVTMAATGTNCTFNISFSGYTVGATTSFMARVQSVLV